MSVCVCVCVWKDVVLYSKWCCILGDWSEYYISVRTVFRLQLDSVSQVLCDIW